jgi:hypothetical protein
MPDKPAKRGNGDRSVTRERINRLLGDIESRFECESGRALVADYTRLLQLELELEDDSLECCKG